VANLSNNNHTRYHELSKESLTPVPSLVLAEVLSDASNHRYSLY